MKLESIIDRYCDVVLTALNVQKGQKLVISGEPCHWDVINKLAARAYQKGMQYVSVNANCSRLLHERLQYSPEKYLTYVPDTIPAQQKVFVREKWARLAISSVEDPNMLNDIPPQKNITVQTAMRKAQEQYKQAVMTDRFNWVVCAIPTPGWAAKVLHRKANSRSNKLLWKVLAPIYRLNTPDPVATWRAHCEKLSQRSAQLNALQLRTLHFKAPGTDLKIGLHRLARWKGGYSTSADGIQFIPNLPTEEVFTTPDYRVTEGTVRLSRPAIIFEKSVEHVELTFKKGKVVQCHAAKNEDMLRGLIETDDGAAMLGEVALVDSSSPIFKSKRIFHNILFDENAACHFAFGAAYPSCLQGGVQMSVAERIQHGINQSVVHTDVMIGSEEIDVIGSTYDDKRVQIIKRGKFHDIA